MALGAYSGELLATVMRRALLFAAIGTTLGFGLGLGPRRVLSSLFYGVSGRDTEIFVMVPVLLAAIALVAAIYRHAVQFQWIPWQRFDASKPSFPCMLRCAWSGC